MSSLCSVSTVLVFGCYALVVSQMFAHLVMLLCVGLIGSKVDTDLTCMKGVLLITLSGLFISLVK